MKGQSDARLNMVFCNKMSVNILDFNQQIYYAINLINFYIP